MEQNGLGNSCSGNQSPPSSPLLAALATLPKLLLSPNGRPTVTAVASSMLSYTKGQLLGTVNPQSPSSMALIGKPELDFTADLQRRPNRMYGEHQQIPTLTGPGCTLHQCRNTVPQRTNQSFQGHSYPLSTSPFPVSSWCSGSSHSHSGVSCPGGSNPKEIALPWPSLALNHTAALFEDDIPAYANLKTSVDEAVDFSTTPIGKLYAMSQVVLRGRQGGMRNRLRRFISGTNTNNDGNVESEETADKSFGLWSRQLDEASSVNSSTSAVDSTIGHMATSGACHCAYCLRERELRWQLFLLQEQQRSDPNIHHHVTQIQFSGPPLQSEHPNNQLQNPLPQGKYVHHLVSKVVYAIILIAHAIYPHIKAFVREIVAYEAENRVLERLVRDIVMSMTWFYQSILMGILRVVLLIVGRSEIGIGSRSLPYPQHVENPDVERIKQLLMSTAAQLISGACEGIESGLDACQRRSRSDGS